MPGLIDNKIYTPPGKENLYRPGLLDQADNIGQWLQQWGPWQPGMTSTDQFLQPYNDPKAVQPILDSYYKLVGTPEQQADKQAYYDMMGGNAYGGVVKAPVSRMNQPAGATDRRYPGNPWDSLNSMGISPTQSVPFWQDQYFMNNSGPGTGIESYNPYYSNGFSTPSWGSPQSYNWGGNNQNSNSAYSSGGMSPWSANSSPQSTSPWG